MPDIYGKYTLTEFSRKLGVTAAFVNRVQKLTKIGGDVGTKGQPASFNDFEIETFRRIKILRTIGFSFPEIKEIWKLEEQLMKLVPDLQQVVRPTEAGEVTLILHSGTVGSYLWKGEGKEIDTYEKAFEDLKRIIMQVKDRKESFIKEAEGVAKFAEELSISLHR
jgi:DNA-binding transcriptional MerR regulator